MTARCRREGRRGRGVRRGPSRKGGARSHDVVSTVPGASRTPRGPRGSSPRPFLVRAGARARTRAGARSELGSDPVDEPEAFDTGSPRSRSLRPSAHASVSLSTVSNTLPGGTRDRANHRAAGSAGPPGGWTSRSLTSPLRVVTTTPPPSTPRTRPGGMRVPPPAERRTSTARASPPQVREGPVVGPAQRADPVVHLDRRTSEGGHAHLRRPRRKDPVEVVHRLRPARRRSREQVAEVAAKHLGAGPGHLVVDGAARVVGPDRDLLLLDDVASVHSWGEHQHRVAGAGVAAEDRQHTGALPR